MKVLGSVSVVMDCMVAHVPIDVRKHLSVMDAELQAISSILLSRKSSKESAL